MAHFAKINQDSIVEQVIAVRNEDMIDDNGNESEMIGKQFIASIGLKGDWIQTSYNASFRGKYAGIGDVWDADFEVFRSPVVEEIPT